MVWASCASSSPESSGMSRISLRYSLTSLVSVSRVPTILSSLFCIGDRTVLRGFSSSVWLILFPPMLAEGGSAQRGAGGTGQLPSRLCDCFVLPQDPARTPLADPP